MDPISPDTNFDDWNEDDLQTLHKARVRQLLLIEYNDGPLILIRRQEAMVRQTRRILHERGIEL